MIRHAGCVWEHGVIFICDKVIVWSTSPIRESIVVNYSFAAVGHDSWHETIVHAGLPVWVSAIMAIRKCSKGTKRQGLIYLSFSDKLLTGRIHVKKGRYSVAMVKGLLRIMLPLINSCHSLRSVVFKVSTRFLLPLPVLSKEVFANSA